jgi:hypothetical protein
VSVANKVFIAIVTLRILKAEHTIKGRRSLWQIGGGWLLQDSDDKILEDLGFRVVTSKVPTWMMPNLLPAQQVRNCQMRSHVLELGYRDASLRPRLFIYFHPISSVQLSTSIQREVIFTI